MHEFSLAHVVIRRLLEIAEEKKAKKILSVKLVIGDLNLLNLNQFKFALKLLSKGTITEGCDFVFEREEIEIKCKKCGFKAKLDIDRQVTDLYEVTQALRCRKCGNWNVEIISGKCLLIREVKVVV